MDSIRIGTDTLGIVLSLLAVVAGILAYRLTHDKRRKFSLEDAFLDEKGKTSKAAIGFFVALTVSTWGFVALIQADKMTEMYFYGYMGAFVANNLASKWIDKKPDAAQ